MPAHVFLHALEDVLFDVEELVLLNEDLQHTQQPCLHILALQQLLLTVNAYDEM
ncbi:MAG: hypothetical protein BWY79_00528 [Actinobacteria bacterium ADurb.Bin444]|nr:MAG: hypothetical protein BWY79_00528 [Actinobacteria bacterium ADurb.Bin444]